MIDAAAIRKVYESNAARHAIGRRRLGRALTLTEKILFTHLADPENQGFERGKSFLDLNPDRVAMQDATAQMAMLQFMLAGRAEAAVPSTVHCDHLIRARVGAAKDMDVALEENNEVYKFLKDASLKYGLGFWKPGAGIIHQVVLENYAFPGGLMIGTDSHTPNAGGLGMFASGVGGADAVDVMVGMPWEVLCPKVIGVKLTGKLSGCMFPKDVILKLLDILTVKGGTNAVMEYFGPGTRSISCTGKATITNMGAELGATTSIFPFDDRMATYLRATERGAIADLAEAHAAELVADPECAEDPAKYYDQVVHIDLSELEPHLVGPHTPDLARPVSRMAADAREAGWPVNLRAALIGSCTNSSYEDIGRSAHVARQAQAAGLMAKIPFLVTPGSDLIDATIRRDGLMETLNAVGGTVLANACGPCIGQWKRDDVAEGENNSIVTSYNRNFRRRNDGNSGTNSFIGSPEIVTALAFAGTLDFDPMKDSLKTADGSDFRFSPPEAPELPADGFAKAEGGFIPPSPDFRDMEVRVAADSKRIELLEPFDTWDGKELSGVRILVKARGKCTTDHISAAGPWLRYRGHLTNISGNMYLGAVNDFDGETGKTIDVVTGDAGVSYPDLAKRWKAAGQGWIVVGDENYGEGSSREHAAMEPRYMGCRAVVAKSFARIAETNLKKQGVLALAFVNPDDYGKFRFDDTISSEGVTSLEPGKAVTLILQHADGTADRVETTHSLNGDQIGWFQAGSALNKLRAADA